LTQIATVGNVNETNVTVPAGTLRLYVQALNSTATSAFAKPVDLQRALPTGISGTGLNESEVKLQWTNPAGARVGLDIERSINGSAWEAVDSVDANDTTFIDRSLEEGVVQYRMRARFSDAFGVFTAPTGNIGLAPRSPTPLEVASVTSSSIQIQWADTSNETGYRVFHSVDGATFTEVSLGANVTSWTANSLLPLHEYYFRVEAFNSIGATSTNIVTQETASPVAVPGPATNLQRSITQVGSTWTATLSWAAAVGTVTAYRVDRRSGVNGSWSAVQSTAALTIQDSGLLADNTYYYRIVPLNSNGTITVQGPVLDEIAATTTVGSPSSINTTPEEYGRLGVNWTATIPNATGYRIGVRGNAGADPREIMAEVSADRLEWTISGLEIGQSYVVDIQAFTPDLAGSWISAAAVVIADKRITAVPTETSIAGVGQEYFITLSQPGITSSMLWTIDWGDGTEPWTGSINAAFPTYDANHVYTTSALDEPFEIRVTAFDGQQTWRAPTLKVTTGLSPVIAITDATRRTAVLAAFNDVYNSIRMEPYSGWKKGPTATKATGGGNDWDQAYLLRDAIFETTDLTEDDIRFKYGVFETTADRAAAWIGAKDELAAERVLLEAGLLATLDANNQWQVATSSPSTADNVVAVWHVLLRVTIGGHTYELDPSWKYKDLRPGVSKVNGQYAVPFNEADYLESASQELPSDWYFRQVEKQIALDPALQRRTSATDLSIDGPIIAKQFKELPDITELRDPLVPFSTIAPDPRHVDLYGTQTDMTYRFRLIVKKPVGAGVEPDTVLDTQVVASTALGSKLLTVEYAAWNDIPDFGIRVNGVNGSETQGIFPAGNDLHTNELSLGEAMSVELFMYKPGDVPSTAAVYRKASFESEVKPFAVILNGDQYNRNELAERQKWMNDFATWTDEGSFSVPDYRSNISRYQGALLGMIGATYAMEYVRARNLAADLTGTTAITDQFDVGFVSGYALDFAFAHGPYRNVDIDWDPTRQNPYSFPLAAGDDGGSAMISLGSRTATFVPTMTETTSASSWRVAAAQEVAGYTSSVLEHAAIEEVTNTLAVSTVKLFAKAFQENSISSLSSFQDSPSNVQAWRDSMFLSLTGGSDAAFALQAEDAILADLAAGYDVIVANAVPSIEEFRGVAWIRVLGNQQDYRLFRMGWDAPHNGGEAAGDASSVSASESASNLSSYGAGTVNLATGDLYYEESDFVLPSPGLNIDFKRRYISSQTVDRGFSPGWTFTYGDYIQLDGENSGNERMHAPAEKVTWFTPSGARYTFTRHGGKYQLPSGLYGNLRFIAGVEVDGQLKRAAQYVYTEKDGTSHTFKVLGDAYGGYMHARLMRVQDRLLNGVELAYVEDQENAGLVSTIRYINGATNQISTDRYVEFLYEENYPDDGQERPRRRVLAVVAHADGESRTWEFKYELFQGVNVLRWAREPQGTDVEQLETEYTYLDELDPLDKAGMRHAMLKRVRRLVNGDPRAENGYQFEYYANRRVFSITDPTGAKETYSYNQFTNLFDDDVDDHDGDGAEIPTRAAIKVNAIGRESRTIYNNDGLPVVIENEDRSRIYQTWKHYRTNVNVDEPNDRDEDDRQYLLETRTNEVGLSEVFQYSRKELPGGKVHTDGSLVVHAVNSWGYDPANPKNVNGVVTVYTYKSIVNPKSRSTIIVPIREVVRKQRTLERDYDEFGNVIQTRAYTTRDGKFNRTDFVYDGTGLLKRQVNPNADRNDSQSIKRNTVFYEYDVHGTQGYNASGSGQLARTFQFTNLSYYPDHPAGPFDYDHATVLSERRYDSFGNLDWTWDGTWHTVGETRRQRIVDYVYDSLGRKTFEIIPDPDGNNVGGDEAKTRYEYNDDQLISVQRRRKSNVVTVSRTWYDEVGRPTKTKELDARTYTSYDAVGNATSFTDANGGRAIYTYDARNRRLQSVVDDGAFERVRLDGAGRTLAAMTPVDVAGGYRLDAAGSVLSTYNGSGWLENTTDTAGRTTVYTRNVFGEVVEERVYGRTADFLAGTAESALSRTLNAHIDLLGRVTDHRTQSGIMILTAYSPNGQVTSTKQYDVSNLGAWYSDLSQDTLKAAARAIREVTTSFDPAGRAITTGVSRTVSEPLAYPIQLAFDYRYVEYDRAGRVTREVSPLGYSSGSGTQDPNNDFSTAYEYDGAGRLVLKTLPPADNGARPTFETTYYPDGTVASQTDAQNNRTAFDYDYFSRTSTTTTPDLKTTQVHMTRGGQVDLRTDELGNETQYQFDSRGRTIATISDTPTEGVEYTGSPVSRTSYDAAGRSYFSQAPNGLRQLTRYDRAGRSIETASFTVGNESTAQIHSIGTYGLRLVSTNHGLNSGDVILLNDGVWGESVVTKGVKVTRIPNHQFYVVEKIDANSFELRSDKQVVAGKIRSATIYTFLPSGAASARTQPSYHKVTGFLSSGQTQYGHAFDSGRVAQEIIDADARDVRSRRIIDGNGREVRKVVARKAGDYPVAYTEPTWSYWYDGFGNRVGSNDPGGVLTSNVYNDRDQLVRSATGHTWGTFYNRIGNTIEVYSENHGLVDGDRLWVNDIDVYWGPQPFEIDGIVQVRDMNTFILVSNDVQEIPDDISVDGRINFQTTTSEYDIEGRLIRSVDARGRATDYDYDNLGRKRLVDEPDPDGSTGPLGRPTTSTDYDLNGNVIRTTNEAGQVSYTQYDVRNRPLVLGTAGRDADLELQGSTAIIALPNHGFEAGDRVMFDSERLSAADADAAAALKGAFAIHRTSDSEFRIEFGTTLPSFQGECVVFLAVEERKYDDAGNLEVVYDARGTATRHFYNELNQKHKTEVDPLVPGEAVRTTHWTYNIDGTISEEISPRGALEGAGRFTTSYYYDALGRKTEVHGHDTDGLASTSDRPVTIWDYDAGGNVTGTIDARGVRTHVTYDGQNRVVATRTAVADVQSIQFAGSLVTVTTKTTHPFDTGDFVVIDGVSSSSTGFSGVFAVTKTTSTAFTYQPVSTPTGDPLAGGAKVYSSLSKSTSAYSLDGNLLSQTDSFGNETRFTYDLLNRNIQTTLADPDGPTSNGRNTQTSPIVRTVYDATGKAIKTIDARGFVSVTQYDDLDRVIVTASGGRGASVAVSGNTATITLSNHRFQSGDRVLISDVSGELTSTQRNMLSRVARIVGQPTTNTFTVTISGNGTTYTAGALVSTGVTTNEYDVAGNIHHTINPVQTVAVSFHDVFNQVIASSPTELSATIALNGTITFNDIHRIRKGERITITGGGLTKLVYTVAEDPTNPTQIVIAAPGETIQPGTISVGRAATTATYDALGRVLEATDALNRTSVTTYDSAGNIRSEKSSTVTVQYSQLSTPVTEYTYDVESNRLSEVRSDEEWWFEMATRTTEWTYDPFGRVATETMPDPVNGEATGPMTSSKYDLVGNVISSTDALGNVTTYAYDALGRKRREEPDPDGPNGSNPGPVTSWAYDPNGNVLFITSPRGNLSGVNTGPIPTRFTTAFKYDALNRKVSESSPDPDGVVGGVAPSFTRYGYDANDNQTWSIDPLGFAALGANPTDSQVLAYVTNGQHSQLSEYDGLNRVIRQRSADDGVTATTHAPPATLFRYDASGRLRSRTDGDDANANTTSFSYDAISLKVEEWIETDSGVQNRSFVHDALGNVIQSTDRNGRVKTFAYDEHNRLHEERWIGGGRLGADYAITHSFDQYGREVQVEDGTVQPDDSVTYDGTVRYEFQYDLLDRVTQEKMTPISPSGGAASTTVNNYDAKGRLTSSSLSTSGTVQVTRYGYDYLDRVIAQSLTKPDTELSGADFNQAVEYRYDADGNISEVIRRGDNNNPNGWQIPLPASLTDNLPYEFNGGSAPLAGGFARLTEENSWTGGSVFTNRRASVDSSFLTSFEYSTPDTDRADGITFTIQNDPRGPGAVGDAGGWLGYGASDGATSGRILNSVSVEFDTWYNPSDGQYFNDPPPANENHVALNVDGSLLSVATEIQTEDLRGDNNHVWIRYDKGATSNESTLKVYWTKSTGQLATVPDESDLVLTYAIDLEEEIGSEWAYFGFTAGTANASAPQDIVSWNLDRPFEEDVTSFVTRYTYDEAGRQSQIKHVRRDPGSSGMVETELSSYTGIDGNGSATDLIGYDVNSRVTALEHVTTKNDTFKDTFFYDDNDQLLERKRGGATTLDNYQYDQRNNRTGGGRVTGKDNRLTNDGTQTIQYDNEGNVTLMGSTRYDYDADNRLIKVSQSGNTIAEYTYDVYGQRLSKTVAGATPTVEHYVLENGDTSVVLNGSLERVETYFRGIRPDEVLSETLEVSGGQRLTWNLPDHQMSVRDVVGWGTDIAPSSGSNSDATGVFTDRFEYSSFGISDTALPHNALIGTWKPRYGYTGQEHDKETSLIYMNARYYDPKNARFISQDPITFEGGFDNLYTYVGNNGPNATDPNGQLWFFVAGAIMTAAAVAVGSVAQNNYWLADTLSDFGGSLADLTGIDSFTLPLGFMSISWGRTDDGVKSFGFGGMMSFGDGVFGVGASTMITQAPGGIIHTDVSANLSAQLAPGVSANVGFGGSGISAGMSFGNGYVSAGPQMNIGRDGSINPSIGVSFGRPFSEGSTNNIKPGFVGGLSYGFGTNRVTASAGLGWWRNTSEGMQRDYSYPNVTGSVSLGSGGTRWEGTSVEWNPFYSDIMYASGQWVCFVAGTPVVVLDESGKRTTRPIESLREGDLVMSRNQHDPDAEVRPRHVVRTFAKSTRELMVLRIRTRDGMEEEIRVTPEHPFWVDGLGWRAASTLTDTNALWTASGKAIVVSVTHETEADMVGVFNLEIEEDHTYFVGEGQLWVHNECLVDLNRISEKTGVANEWTFQPGDAFLKRFNALSDAMAAGIDYDTARQYVFDNEKDELLFHLYFNHELSLDQDRYNIEHGLPREQESIAMPSGGVGGWAPPISRNAVYQPDFKLPLGNSPAFREFRDVLENGSTDPFTEAAIAGGMSTYRNDVGNGGGWTPVGAFSEAYNNFSYVGTDFTNGRVGAVLSDIGAGTAGIVSGVTDVIGLASLGKAALKWSGTAAGRRLLTVGAAGLALNQAEVAEGGVHKTAMNVLRSLGPVARQVGNEERGVAAGLLRSMRVAGASHAEIVGIRIGMRKMWSEDWRLIPAFFHYGSNEGVDLAFRRGASVAALEAKAGRGTIGRLPVSSDGLRQASHEWNRSRIEKFLEMHPENQFANELNTAAQTGSLRSFVSFGRRYKLNEVP
jgi:RHS repeat-associated protein